MKEVLIFLVVAILRVAELNVIPLEAAFQGKRAALLSKSLLLLSNN